MSKTYVTVLSVEQYHDDDKFKFEGKLSDLINQLQDIIQSVPEQYHSDLMYDISTDSSGHGSYYATFKLEYQRDKTAEELAADEARLARDRASIEARERATLENLRAKYGDK